MGRIRLALLEILAVAMVLCAANSSTAQFNNFVSTANLPCGSSCPPLDTIQKPVFQNLFVFVPNLPGETWDHHLAEFITDNPQYGPPTCMNGTAFPCLQDLTSEAINNFVQALVNSNYFNAMENSYGVGAPFFAGEQALLPQCAPSASLLAHTPFGPTGAAQNPNSISWLDMAALVNCQASFTRGPTPQFNLIFAPDLLTPAQITQPPVCPNPSNPNATENAFHSAAPSGINIQQYLNIGFQNEFQQCVLSLSNPIGPFVSGNNCLANTVAQTCYEAALGGAVACPIGDIIFPGLCETLVTIYVTSCVTAAGTVAGIGSEIETLEANKLTYTAIPTNPECFASLLNTPRQIVGGGAANITTGGNSEPLDNIAVSISHEMTEAITDPGGFGWVHPSSDVTGQYNTGEIADICEPSFTPPPVPLGSLPNYMPFYFLHAARYWSNVDQKCMPQFDASNDFFYGYVLSNCVENTAFNQTECGFGPAGNPLLAVIDPTAQSPFPASASSNQPNVRVTDLSSSSPQPQRFGNSIDPGSSGPLSYSAFLPSHMVSPFSFNAFPGSQQAAQISAPVNSQDVLVLEMWEPNTGQGPTTSSLPPNTSVGWPPPTTCVLQVQRQINGTTPCTATLFAETLAYGLPEPPLDGNVVYTVSSGTCNGSATCTCDAIRPCAISVTLPNGSGPVTLSASDTITTPAMGPSPLPVGPLGVPRISGGRPAWASAIPPVSCSTTVKLSFPIAGANACLGGSFTVSVNVEGGGTVGGAGSSSTSNINCSNNSPSATTESGICSAPYSFNGNVVLNAKAKPGWTFQGWFGAGCIGVSSTCSSLVESPLTVTARFTNSATGLDIKP